MEDENHSGERYFYVERLPRARETWLWPYKLSTLRKSTEIGVSILNINEKSDNSAHKVGI
jgi:hypothetical protein